MKFYLTLFFILFSKFLFCQVDFDRQIIIYESLNTLNCEIIMDVDGDNKLDIVTSTQNSGLGWYKNLGSQEFSSLIVINNTIYSSSIISKDIDGDGDLDFLIADQIEFFWLENLNGLGEFSDPKPIFPLPSNFLSHYLEDINGDMSLDLIIFNKTLKEISCYPNDGLGNFGTPIILQDARMINVFPVDIDSDGDVDIITYSGYGNVNTEPLSWFENLNGLGDFNQKQMLLTDSLISTIYPADIDGDGDLDLITGSYSNDNKISWYENLDGLVNFSEEVIINNSFGYGFELALKDINSDGYGDLIVKSINKTVGFENLNGNGFSNDSLFYLISSSKPSLQFGDFDDDGDLDFLGTTSTNYYRQMIWFENTGSPNFFNLEDHHDISIWNVSHATDFIATIDLDNDDDLDLLTSGGGLVLWYENINENNPFGVKQNIISLNQVSVKELTDIDNDNDLDLLLVDVENKLVSWKENLGEGIFNQTNAIAVDDLYSGDQYINVFTAEINNDDNVDIVTCSISKISWVENMGAGVFGDSHPILIDTGFLINVFANTLISADLDSDGDDDILLFAYYYDSGSEFIWLENDGNGTFIKHIISYSFENLSYIKTGDIDGDGDLDVVVGTYSEEKDYYWFENTDGLGDFGLRIPIGDAEFSNTLLIEDYLLEDIDGDNDIDLIVQDGKLRWFENTDGNGFFGPIQFIDNSVSINSICFGDVNGDGDLDIVLSEGYVVDHLYWYENVTNQSSEVESIDNNSVNIFPNPASNELFINSKEKIKFVEIYNSIGQKLNTSFHDSKFNISKLIPGMYFCKIIFQSGEFQINNFIKE